MRACKYETNYRQDYHCAWCARAFTINIPICRKEELRRGEHLPSVRPSARPSVGGAIISHACLRKLLYSTGHELLQDLDDAGDFFFYDPLSINIMQIANNVQSN